MHIFQVSSNSQQESYLKILRIKCASFHCCHQAHVAHSQGGQRGKSNCSPMLVLGIKVPFSNGKSFVLLRCCSIIFISSIMWIKTKYPSQPVSVLPSVDGTCLQRAKDALFLFFILPTQSQSLVSLVICTTEGGGERERENERLKLILEKTKWYISAGSAWDVHQCVYQDYETFIHNILFAKHSFHDETQRVFHRQTLVKKFTSQKLLQLPVLEDSHQWVRAQCDLMTYWLTSLWVALTLTSLDHESLEVSVLI